MVDEPYLKTWVAQRIELSLKVSSDDPGQPSPHLAKQPRWLRVHMASQIVRLSKLGSYSVSTLVKEKKGLRGLRGDG